MDTGHIVASIEAWNPMINLVSTIIMMVGGYFLTLKNRLKKIDETVYGDEEKDGLLKRVQTLEENTGEEQEQQKKIEEHLYGDAVKDGVLKRVQKLEETCVDTKEFTERVRAVEKQSEDCEKELTDFQKNYITQQQEAITKALAPLWKRLEKKADKEMLEVQVAHLLERLTALGRQRK